MASGKFANVFKNLETRVDMFVQFARPDTCFWVFNCSQTKFVAIILVLLVFFYAIFRLTDFSSDAFDFSSSKTG